MPVYLDADQDVPSDTDGESPLVPISAGKIGHISLGIFTYKSVLALCGKKQAY
jgi:hypothetical protein